MMSASFTWQLRVNPLRHVRRQVARHLPPDVHQHSGVGRGDLVDEDGAGVGQHQLSVVGFELRTVLEGQRRGESEATQDAGRTR